MNRLSARSGTILAFLAIGLTLGFAVTGMGFGLWIQQFSVQETLESGNVDLVFSSAFTDDDGIVDDPLLDSQDNASSTQVFDAWGPSSSADPAATGPDAKPHYDKDVARCQALIDGSVSQDQAYPSYNCTAWFEMQNSGTIPLKVKRIRVNTASGSRNLDSTGDLVPIDIDDIDSDVDNSTGADAGVAALGLALCQQIDPGETVQVAILSHALPAAPQGDTLTYAVDVDAAQWNELATSTDPMTEAYADAFDVLGGKALVLPLGDFPTGEFHACPSAVTTQGEGFESASFDTVGAQAITFAWNEPPEDFDTPAGFAGEVPIVTLNGSNETASSPDADNWSFGDGITDSPGSLGLWIKINDTGSARGLLSKWETTGGNREWVANINSSEIAGLTLRDDANGKNTWISMDSSLPTGVWIHLVFTYDGRGGSDAYEGIAVYVDGLSVPVTGGTNAGYVAMANGTAPVELGTQDGGSNRFVGTMGGGANGPFFVRREIEPSEVVKLYTLGALALGLIP